MRRLAVIALALCCLAPATASAQPNIILVITDDQELGSVSVMPNLTGLDHLATFTNAYENTPLCCPSRATIFSGLYDHQHGIFYNNGTNFDDSATIATWLDSAGYETGLYGKYLNKYPFGNPGYIPPGWDHWASFSDEDEGGPAQNFYNSYTLNEDGTDHFYGTGAANYSTDVLANKLDAFIASADVPFFAVFAPHAPHAPFTAAIRDRTIAVTLPPDPPSIGEDVSDKPAWVQNLAPANMTTQHKDLTNSYRSMMAVDDAIGQFKSTLETQGEWDNTVLIYLTDNGYSFGEHNVLRKMCVYQECIRTPMYVHYPGLASGDYDALVQNIDLAPTIAELAGATPTLPEPGQSLVSYLEGGSPPARDDLLLHLRSAANALPGFWGIVTDDGWKYDELKTGEVEFYDLLFDPYELNNLAGDPDWDAMQAVLADELATAKAQAGASGPP